MTNQIISLSENAAKRITEIMTSAEKNSIGVRVGVKAGGCAGMSYVMEYTKEINPNDEVIEDKGVKVFMQLCTFWVQKWIIKKMIFHPHLYSKILMRPNDVDAENRLKYSFYLLHIRIA